MKVCIGFDFFFILFFSAFKFYLKSFSENFFATDNSQLSISFSLLDELGLASSHSQFSLYLRTPVTFWAWQGSNFGSGAAIF